MTVGGFDTSLGEGTDMANAILQMDGAAPPGLDTINLETAKATLMADLGMTGITGFAVAMDRMQSNATWHPRRQKKCGPRHRRGLCACHTCRAVGAGSLGSNLRYGRRWRPRNAPDQDVPLQLRRMFEKCYPADRMPPWTPRNICLVKDRETGNPGLGNGHVARARPKNNGSAGVGPTAFRSTGAPHGAERKNPTPPPLAFGCLAAVAAVAAVSVLRQ